MFSVKDFIVYSLQHFAYLQLTSCGLFLVRDFLPRNTKHYAHIVLSVLDLPTNPILSFSNL